MSVFGLLGMLMGLPVMVLNSLTVLTVVRTRSLWTPSHLYVSSLALSDLLLGVLLVCTGVRDAAEMSNIPFCLILWFFFLLCMWTSVLLSTVISIDRYVCIGYPYFYERVITNKKVISIVVCTWVASILLSITMIIIGVVLRPGSCMAGTLFADTKVLSMAVFLVCFTIIGVTYWKISIVALHQQREVACQRVLQQAEIQPLRETFRQKMRAVKLFLVVFVAFLVCWLPMNVSQLVNTFRPVPLRLQMAVSVPGMLNSLCNFFIYLGISRDFRTALRRLCTRR